MKDTKISDQTWNRVTKALCLLALIALIAAFWNRQIHNDEAWIGQQVWSLDQNGAVESELFRDCPPLDKEIVVYHKLLVWNGLGVSKVAGWGLYQLRSVAFLAGLLTLALLFWQLSQDHDRRLSWRVTAVLLLTPVFWLQMLEFRPESLLLLLGMLSYFTIEKAQQNPKLTGYALAGLLAGFAGLAHAFGFVFVIAGFVALIIGGKRTPAITLLIFGVIGFSPYVTGYFTNRELFIEQTINNPLMTTALSFDWWQPLVNLLTEHKRILRKPEVIGLTVWFLLSLPFVRGGVWRKNRFLFIYLIVTAVVLAASPLPKFTRYMIPLVPFMAIVIARVSMEITKPLTDWRRHAAMAFRIWSVLFMLYGGYALVYEAIPKQKNQIEVNTLLAEKMQQSSLVMTPFDFVFMQQGNFTIQSWWGVERAAGESKSISFLENYADSLGVEHLIVDPVIMSAWQLDENLLKSGFTKYRLQMSLPDARRYLLSKIHGQIESQ